MEIITLFATIFVCVVFRFLFKDNRKNVNNFPSPPGHFFFGHIFYYKAVEDRISISLHFIKRYGPSVKLKMGPSIDAILTTDSKMMKFFLTKSNGLVKSENYLYLRSWLRNGLLIAEGPQWKHTRKILTPTFNVEVLKTYVEVFERVGDVLVQKMKEFGETTNVDLSNFIPLCTLDVICETAMGTKMNSQQGENASYVNSVGEMCQILMNRNSSVLKLKNWSFILTGDYYRQRKIVKSLHEFTSNVIAKRKEKMSVEMNKNRKLAFLDLLLNYRSEGGEVLSEEQIRQEVDTFMFAGHDTTAAGLSFTLYCLSKHPHIQNKVLNEQKEMFGDEKNPIITYQDLQNMKYLENVVKESLRLYPPVPVVGRLTTKNLEIEDGIIGKNTNIAMFIYGLHRNPEYFPEPEKFEPDRFNMMDGSNSWAFLPFGAGQRNCIGQKFAVLEIKSVVAKLVRHFEFRAAVPIHDLVLAPEIVLKSLNGVKVGLKQRV